jgi:heparan-alpha-glucosaminide N-acetyltransferase
LPENDSLAFVTTYPIVKIETSPSGSCAVTIAAMTTTSPTPTSVQPATPTSTSVRIASIDVFRGLVMFLMLFQMVRLPVVAEKMIEEGRWPGFWKVVAFHTEHVEWEGGSLHDMIQPGFSFLVGAALAFSMVSRRKRGQSWWRMLFHVILRSIALVLLGVALRNLKTDSFVFRFEDTLCQIGLGYLLLFLIASLPKPAYWIAFVSIVVGWWIVFVSYPSPPADFDYASVGVAEDWPYHKEGLASHWNKNSNVATAFDQWFLNKFPRPTPYQFNEGGYATLNFVPTLATMILGLIAGTWLRDGYSLNQRHLRFILGIAVGLSVGWLLSVTGLCPIVKRIWTPSWVLWSGGWCLLLLYVFHLICDVWGWKAWSFPLTVIGSNSIAAYVMSFATVPFLRGRVQVWFQSAWKEVESPTDGSLWMKLSEAIGIPAGKNSADFFIGLVVFVLVWLILYWMHRQRLYIRL